MQANIKNIEILKHTYQKGNHILSSLQDSITHYIKELEQLNERCPQELRLSQNFLNVAKVYEQTKFTLLAKAQAELARAMQAEVSALASGFPPAIAAASVWVARASSGVAKATKEYQEAKKNRINMEKRVHIATNAYNKAKSILEESRRNFHINFQNISTLTQQLIVRLQKADSSIGEYLVESLASGYNEVDKFFKSVGISDIEKEFLETSKVQRVDGKLVVKRDITFKPYHKDGLNRSNLDRMKGGLPPIGTDGKSIELHHLKQKDNGIIIELNSEEHKEHSKTLHRYKSESEINRQEFEKWKRKYWKQRYEELKEIEC